MAAAAAADCTERFGGGDGGSGLNDPTHVTLLRGSRVQISSRDDGIGQRGLAARRFSKSTASTVFVHTCGYMHTYLARPHRAPRFFVKFFYLFRCSVTLRTVHYFRVESPVISRLPVYAQRRLCTANAVQTENQANASRPLKCVRKRAFLRFWEDGPVRFR